METNRPTYFEEARLRHPLLFEKPKGLLGKDWHVLDDHVNINKNVIVIDNTTFVLTARPVGITGILRSDDPNSECIMPNKERTIHTTVKIDGKEFAEQVARICDEIRVKAERANLQTKRIF